MKEDGYRLNVGLIISNNEGKLLLCKRKGMNSWQFPQGGIDNNESPLNTAQRELFEEVGIQSKSTKLISSIDGWLKYDVPKKSRRRRFLNKKFKGQKQKWFLFRLKEDVKISFENDPDNEFEDYKWVSYWYPLYTIIFFKKEVYRKVLNSLSSSFCNEFNHD